MFGSTISYARLLELGIPKEDIANILPLGSETTIVLKINARALIHMSEIRLCSRAYIEYRELMKQILKVVSQKDKQWKWIVDNFCKVKCVKAGYCTEAKSCGYRPHKDNVTIREDFLRVTKKFTKAGLFFKRDEIVKFYIDLDFRLFILHNESGTWVQITPTDRKEYIEYKNIKPNVPNYATK